MIEFRKVTKIFGSGETTVRAVDDRTRVEITADSVPDGISADDHAEGMSSSLDNLAAYMES